MGDLINAEAKRSAAKERCDVCLTPRKTGKPRLDRVDVSGRVLMMCRKCASKRRYALSLEKKK
jgi:RNase P subunit RPR2